MMDESNTLGVAPVLATAIIAASWLQQRSGWNLNPLIYHWSGVIACLVLWAMDSFFGNLKTTSLFPTFLLMLLGTTIYFSRVFGVTQSWAYLVLIAAFVPVMVCGIIFPGRALTLYTGVYLILSSYIIILHLTHKKVL
jgi:hypothetical protein